jgi:N4-(beta-N-acetylglucosaminyl)-L-asparaginase
MSVESEDSVQHAVQGSQADVCQGWSQNEKLLEPTNTHSKFVNHHNHDTISMAVIDKVTNKFLHSV